MSEATIRDCVLACSASAQTDSLAVVWDLTKVSGAAERAILATLAVPDETGAQMPPRNFDAFDWACGSTFNRLLTDDPCAAFQFATMIAVFFHECRHIHDVRLTRVGTELLLLELGAYNEAPQIVRALCKCQAENPAKRILYPLAADALEILGCDADAAAAWRRLVDHRALSAGLRTGLSRFRTIPGLSIENLFETMGYVVQRDLSLQLFGEQAGLVMIDAISEESRRVYLEPVRRMQILCGARGHPGPNALDVSSTISDALTVSCISEGFDETGRATDRHPGAWFDRFSEMFALTPTDLHENPLARPVAAVDRALAAEGLGDMLERIAEADEAIVRQQLLMAQDLMCNLSKGPGAAVLVATEIAADFHEMQSAVTRHHDYHDPIGYARLLLAGELTGVYVILRTRGGTRDFRTPSHIPSNHVGAFRAAAQSAKQMDRLAAGFLAEEDFVDKELLEQMLAPAPHGLGLNLQLK